MNDSSIIARVRAKALPLRGDDVDTDRIIPARYLRAVTFDGLGEFAFRDARFEPDGTRKAHPFNDGRYAGAGVLIVGRNFGCGSSREHAPQALARWGIKAIVGESFADIFAGNCAAIGLVAVRAAAADIERLYAAAEAGPEAAEAEIDLVSLACSLGSLKVKIELPEARRRNFLAGTWDTTGTLLANKGLIAETAAKLPYLNAFPARA